MHRYSSAAAFRRALEDRLKRRALERGEDLGRLRRLVAFDRFLARLFSRADAPNFVVKGGFGLEIRYRMDARTTKDIDLSLPDPSLLGGNLQGDLSAVLEALRDASARDLGDHFVIYVAEPRQDFDAPPQGGARFPVDVRLDGKRFASFHLDVGLGDVITEAPDWCTGEPFLDFAELAPARIPLLPVAQQVAEKLHVYTLPRKSLSNSRVKDLVDLVLLIEQDDPDPERVRRAVLATFERRATHAPPPELPFPPAGWEIPYAAMAREAGALRKTVEEAYAFVAQLWKSLSL